MSHPQLSQPPDSCALVPDWDLAFALELDRDLDLDLGSDHSLLFQSSPQPSPLGLPVALDTESLASSHPPLGPHEGSSQLTVGDLGSVEERAHLSISCP